MDHKGKDASWSLCKLISKGLNILTLVLDYENSAGDGVTEGSLSVEERSNG